MSTRESLLAAAEAAAPRYRDLGLAPARASGGRLAGSAGRGLDHGVAGGGRFHRHARPSRSAHRLRRRVGKFRCTAGHRAARGIRRAAGIGACLWTQPHCGRGGAGWGGLEPDALPRACADPRHWLSGGRDLWRKDPPRGAGRLCRCGRRADGAWASSASRRPTGERTQVRGDRISRPAGSCRGGPGNGRERGSTP